MTLKKKLIMLVVLVLSLTLYCFGLVACGGNNDVPPNNGQQTEESTNSGEESIDWTLVYNVRYDGSITGLTEYGRTLTKLFIPETLNDKKITSIGIRAFYECSSLKSITIPDNVTSIEYCAFYGCTALKSIIIPNSVTSIGENAFQGCGNLNKVIYKGTVYQWAQISFSHSYSNPIYYAKKLYVNDILLTEANVTTATKINDYAFYNCDSLTSIGIPDSVTSIGDCAFNGCTSLSNVTLGNSVTSIGDCAFCGCKLLKSMVMPNSVTSIGDYAFEGCTSLTSVIIPDNVTSIGSWAFSGCSSLTSVTIGNGVTSIGNSAFRSCYNLNKVNYTGTVDQWVQIGFDSWGSNPTYYAKNLYINDVLLTEANITTATKINAYAFQNCYSLTKVVIPGSVTHIGEKAFCACMSLTCVTIGNGVDIIAKMAFYDCDNLTSVTFENTEGWFISKSLDTKNGKEVTLTEATQNAYLIDIYYNYYWRRK